MTLIKTLQIDIAERDKSSDKSSSGSGAPPIVLFWPSIA